SEMLQEEIVCQINSSIAAHVTNKSLEILDLLIEPTYIWTNLSETVKFDSSSTIFQTVRDLFILMNVKQNESQTDFSFTHIRMQSKLFSTEANQSISFAFENATLKLPFGALNSTDLNLFSQIEDEFIAATATVLRSFPAHLSLEELKVNS